MTDQLFAAPDVLGQPEPIRIASPTGWTIKQRVSAGPTRESTCTCGAEVARCAGCGHPRCLACDPYLSDDCRWRL
jgi:hypothetical protein